ncbi:MAG: HepT-like ribonuclease domain-containing protein [bacterium]
MANRKSDTIRIRHMADAARKAVLFTQTKSRIDLDTDEQLALALVRLIEIIGEAASKVTEEIKVQFPIIPWKNIVGTRNRIIHAYENVDYDILWQIVHVDLPVLIQQLEEVLHNLKHDDQQSGF